MGAVLGILEVLFSVFGFVVIKSNQVGLIEKRFGKSLPHGKIVALNGEAGYQAQTLAPGWHWFYWPWQYKITKTGVIQVPQGQIALIVAEDGSLLDDSQLLGKNVECSNFQDGRAFLEAGGQKGRQIGFLKTGIYRINTVLFNVITTENCSHYGLTPFDLSVKTIEANEVGIVTTQAGIPLSKGKIAGSSSISDHSNFQNPQAFLDKNGFKGLQEEVLLAGTYTLNPWFVSIQKADMTEVPVAHVGVVISSSGDDDTDISGDEFKHGNLVKAGGRGIWATPLLPGRHPVNTETCKVEIVPTSSVVLNWADTTESHQLDNNLSSIKVRAKDGFSFSMDVSQIIHIAANDAAKVISRVGSMKNLVDQVLEPIIGNYFRNAAQGSEILDFIQKRTEQQTKAAEFIKKALTQYNVVGVDTLIGDLVPPEELMKTLTDRKIASEQKETFKTQEESQKQRQAFMKEQSLADEQKRLMTAAQSVNVAESAAQEAVKKADGEAKALIIKAKAEAESITLKATAEANQVKVIGEARANSYKLAVEAVGANNFSNMEIFAKLSDNKIKITPEVMVTGGIGSDNGGSLATALVGKLLVKDDGKKPSETPPTDQNKKTA